MKRYGVAVAVLGALVGTACGSSASKPAASNTTAPTQSNAPTTTRAPSKHGALTVSGSLTLSLDFSTGSHGRCNAPSPGTQGNTTGVLDFDNGTDYYALQFSLARGTSTFPGAAGKSFVAFFASTDSTKEWSIGTNVTKADAGTVTFTGTQGTVDVDMAPDPPNPNPALKPIHVKGTFECT